ncbi:MAG: hypothetical protein ABFD82_02545 [Syntrophaceae bacterium]
MHEINRDDSLSPFRFLILVLFLIFSEGCSTTSTDLIPSNIVPSPSGCAWHGSVNVQATVLPKNYEDLGAVSTWTDGDKFTSALRTAIARKRLFKAIEPASADYVLDVWAYLTRKVEHRIMVYEMDTIWRLTRVKDGKVLICDFTNASAKSGRGITRAIEVTRETIDKGLWLLSDKSQLHMGATPAKIRPSMGPVETEDLKIILENWKQLHAGMTFDEATMLLDPFMILKESMKDQTRIAGNFKIPGRIIPVSSYDSDYNYDTNGRHPGFKERFISNSKGFLSDSENIEITDFVMIRDTRVMGSGVFLQELEYTTDVYTLAFKNSELKEWKLRGASANH